MFRISTYAIAVYVILVTTVATIVSDRVAILVLISAAGFLLVGVYINEGLLKNDIFHPAFFFSLSYILSIWGQGIDVFLRGPEQLSWIFLGYGYSYLVFPSLVILIGVSALIAGLLSEHDNLLVRRWSFQECEWDPERAAFVSKSFILIGFIFYGIFIYTIDISFSLESLSKKRNFPTVYLDHAVKLIHVGILVYLANIYYNCDGLLSLDKWKLGVSRTLPFLGILGAIGFSYPVLKSVRSGVLFLFIMLLSVRHYVHRRTSLRTLVILFPPLAFIGGLMAGLRRIAWDNSASLSDYIGILELFKTIIGSDRGGLAATSHLIHNIPGEFTFAFGRTLAHWIVFPIPREIWSGKPVHLAREVAIRVYDTSNATPPTLSGELYYNFHLIGVIVGLYLLGLFAANVYNLLLTHNGKPETAILYIITAIHVFGFGIVTLTMINYLAMLVPALLGLVFIHR